VTLTPQSKVKLSLVDYAKITAFLITWTLIGYAFVSSGHAQQHLDQTLNEARFNAIKEWQYEAGSARLRIFDTLEDIQKSLSRIEGRLEKK